MSPIHAAPERRPASSSEPHRQLPGASGIAQTQRPAGTGEAAWAAGHPQAALQARVAQMAQGSARGAPCRALQAQARGASAGPDPAGWAAGHPQAALQARMAGLAQGFAQASPLGTLQAQARSGAAASMQPPDTGPRPAVQRAAEAPADPTGLPGPLKAGIEALSGLSVDDVRVHYNSSKPAQLQALAYTQGTDIYVGAGQEQHLPHEAWHVVQQKQGRVRATHAVGGVSVNADASLEAEATAQGHKALQRVAPGRAAGRPAAAAASRGGGTVAQAFGGLSWEMLGGYNPRRHLPERLGGYSPDTMTALREQEKAAREANHKARKLEIVKNVVATNVKAEMPGWFDLKPDQLQTYTQRVFGFLEKVRQTDMTTLMLAHQQVNDEAKAAPEDKVKTLTKHIAHNESEIAKLSDFDQAAVKEALKRKELERARLQLELDARSGKSVNNSVKSMLQDRVRMDGDIKAFQEKIRSLQQAKKKGAPEIKKLEKLKQHKARMERERAFQQKHAGKEGVNIDFINTSDVGDGGDEVVRAYMAIVAPNYDNRFKDFYLSNTKRLTYSANDKVMWVSFGTPLRSLSWFQKYALAATTDKTPTNGVPLIRSFELPMSYFEKHVQQISTEAADSPRGKILASQGIDLNLKDAYGDEEFGTKYQSRVDVVDPYMMNVDVKYPNQFGVGRVKHGVETGAPGQVFEATKKKADQLKKEMESQNFGTRIKELTEQISALKEQCSKLDELPQNDGEIDEKLRGLGCETTLGEEDPYRIKGQDQQSKRSNLKISAESWGKVLRAQEHFKAQVDDLRNQVKVLREQETIHKAGQKKLSAGDSHVKSHVNGVANQLEAQVKQRLKGDMASTAMTDLLAQALPGSFRTVALANDRKYEHVPDKEGHLHDYNEFVASLGLGTDGKPAEFHLLDENNTALHTKAKEKDKDKEDAKWASATPDQTQHIYEKMRFFYHKLDGQTKEVPPYNGKQPDKFSADNPDLTRDSHLAHVVSQIQKKPKAGTTLAKLATVYESVDIESQISSMLTLNHFTPADVFGLPEDVESAQKDRHGNSAVKSAAETYFAQKQLGSDSSLDFVAQQSSTLLAHMDSKTHGKQFTQELLGIDYLKRDIQEILGVSAYPVGIDKAVDFNGDSIRAVLQQMKDIKKVQQKHKRLRMVYVFLHMLRPLARTLGNEKSLVRSEPINERDKGLNAAVKRQELLVNNRTETFDQFNFLNPRAKTFGIMDQRDQQPDKASMMPYDIYSSPMRYVPKAGNEMSKYMAAIDMPFVGGVSGTTRDQTQMLPHIFDDKTLKDHYWDLQLMNAAFMIGNGYHSFFETIYVAARYDRTGKGSQILKQFSSMRGKKYGNYDAYVRILQIIGVNSDIFEGFEEWYAAQLQAGKEVEPAFA